MQQIKDSRIWAARAICLLAGLALFYLAGKYGVSLLMPFLLAGVLVLFVRPVGKRLAKLTGIRTGICNVAVLLALLGILGAALYLGGYYLWREASSFYVWLSENADSLAGALGGLFATGEQGMALPAFVQKILALPLIADFFGGLDALAQSLTHALLTKLGEAATKAAIDIASGLPSFALFVLVFGFSCFYLALDGERLFAWGLNLLQEDRQKRVRRVCASVVDALYGYLRAYGLIFFMTFAELLVGFMIIRVRYAFLIAVLTALVDLLPVLGSGVVLIPWSIVSFMSGNVYTGAGLLILYGVITLVRQITEPKIVGNSLGLHPLATLVSMYVGFRLFGAIGLVAGPCVCIVGKSVVGVRLMNNE